MSAYWFKPRERGYGNVPTTWQGWALTVPRAGEWQKRMANGVGARASARE
jgi:hypothetical protein